MARKPVHLQPAGSLTPRDRVWAEIRKQRKFSLTSLEDKTRVNEDTIRTYVYCLLKAGIIETAESYVNGRTPEGKYHPNVYRLVRDVGVSTPRFRKDGSLVTQGGESQAMWRSMRIMKGSFNVRELILIASTENATVSEQTAKTYCKFLERAGYLRIVSPGGPHRLTRYEFVRTKDTGPRAPMIQRIKQVWDPNIGKIVWAPKPEEVADAQSA